MIYFLWYPNEDFYNLAIEVFMANSIYRRTFLLSILQELQMLTFGFVAEPALFRVINVREVGGGVILAKKDRMSKNGCEEGMQSQTETVDEK